MKLQNYNGLNNVTSSRELTLKDLTMASNVDLTLEGRPLRRQGYVELSTLKHANVWKGDGFTLATRGVAGDLCALNSAGAVTATLAAGLTHARMWYADLPGGRVLYSNGISQGIARAASAQPWGVPIPATAGAAASTAGLLYSGDYQWSLTHVRKSDNMEGGQVDSNAVVTVTTGGISFTGLPVVAGYRTNVYITSANGGQRYFVGATETGALTYAGKNSALQQRVLTDDLRPPPLGTIVGFWRGRTLVAVGKALFASKPNSWELFDLRRDYKLFADNITLVQPVDGGIWVGTAGELAFLSGETWDKLERHVRDAAPVVLGSGCAVPGEHITTGQGRLAGNAMVCICNNWLVAGSSEGEVIPLTRDRYSAAFSQVWTSFRVQGDAPQYMAQVLDVGHVKTIVLNTATAAVTEYGWQLQSISDAYAASDAGFYRLGGDLDAAAQIVGEFRTGTPGGNEVRSLGNVFVAMETASDGVLVVQGKSANWEYPLVNRSSGVASASPGRGISESYLGFGFRNTAGAAFRIDTIEAEVVPSINRRK